MNKVIPVYESTHSALKSWCKKNGVTIIFAIEEAIKDFLKKKAAQAALEKKIK